MIRVTILGIPATLNSLEWVCEESEIVQDMLHDISEPIIEEMNEESMVLAGENPDLDLAQRLQKKHKSLDIDIVKVEEPEPVPEGAII